MYNIYEEYALLETEAKKIAEKKEQLRKAILESMVASGESKKETQFGSFSVSKLKKWSYPEYVTKMEEDYKEAKAKAESTNEATYTEQDSLRFNLIKL